MWRVSLVPDLLLDLMPLLLAAIRSMNSECANSIPVAIVRTVGESRADAPHLSRSDTVAELKGSANRPENLRHAAAIAVHRIVKHTLAFGQWNAVLSTRVSLGSKLLATPYW